MTVTTLTYTGTGPQTYTVPAGVTWVTLECWGAAAGAYGGYSKGNLIVASGTVLNVYVGGAGGTGSYSAAGFNGGGAGASYLGQGGGGASDVRLGGTALSNRVIVAGGAGGTGGNANSSVVGYGGAGGGTSGGNGVVGDGGAVAGGAGTQSVGTLGLGAAGSVGANAGGGGGGGGYRGGGGADGVNGTGNGSGGGGGSGYLDPSLSSATTSTSTNNGNGYVTITAVNTAPYAPPLNTPANNTAFDRAVTQRFAWTFSDPDTWAGDTQSKFDLQYRLGTGAWVPVTGTTSGQFWDAAGGTFTVGAWEWQVRTYDLAGLVGPWSASSFFTASDAPTVPTVTTPAAGATVPSTATLTWTTGAHTDYQVRKVADIAGVANTATVYYDTGDVVDGATSSVMLSFPVNLRWEHIQVRVSNSGLWSVWADVRVYVSWTPPMVPLIALTPNSATASIAVAVTNPTPTGGAPATSYNDVYASSPLDPEIRVATQIAVNSVWTWMQPGAVRVYNIRAVAVGSNGTTSTSA